MSTGYKNGDLIINDGDRLPTFFQPTGVATSWTGPRTANTIIYYTRIGSFVFISVLESSPAASGASAVWVSDAIPSNFRVGAGYAEEFVKVTDNSSNIMGLCQYSQADFKLRLYTDLAGGGFSNTGNCGFSTFSITLRA